MGRLKTPLVYLDGRPAARIVDRWLVRDDVTRNRDTWSRNPAGWRLPALWVLVTADGYRYVERSGRVWEVTRPVLLRFMEKGDLDGRTVVVPQEHWYTKEPEPIPLQGAMVLA